MSRVRVLYHHSTLLKAFVPILFGCRLLVAESCQPAARPEELIRTIAAAEHKAKMSTEILRLMLPCPGTPVSASGLLATLNAGFPAEQTNIILSSFRLVSVDLLDLERLILAPTQNDYKSRLLASSSTVSISSREIMAINLRSDSAEQVTLMSQHCSLRASESELQALLESGEQTKVVAFLENSLETMQIKAERTVKLLAQHSQRTKLLRKLCLSDARLWAVALKSGIPTSAVAMLNGPNDVAITDMLRYGKQQSISDSIMVDFLIEQQSHWKPLAKDDVCTRTFSSLPIDRLFRALGHPPLTLSIDCVASLKEQGMADKTILGLMKKVDKEHSFVTLPNTKRDFPAPPEIITINYADPFNRMQGLETSHTTRLQGDEARSVQNGGVYRAGGEVSQPVLISKVEPEYSKEARKANLSGMVLLSFVVDANGLPHNVHVVRPLGLGLDEKAIEAVMKWRFRPALKGGKSVAVQAQAEINFHIYANPDGKTDARLASSSSDLHVEILQVQWSSTQYGARGFGKGNVSGSQPRQGFDFTFSCSAPFLPSEGNGYYPASWKKPGTKLIIITTKIGSSDKHGKCELSTSLLPYIFEVIRSDLRIAPMH